MSIFLIASTEDPAGITIKQQLLTLTQSKELSLFMNQPILQLPELTDTYLVTIPDRTIYHDNLDKELEKTSGIKPDLIIFLSRHSSKMKTPTLTTHPIGNYGSADFGGNPRTLVPAAPHTMTQLLRKIHEKHQRNPLGFKVCYEVTHHGPFLSTPTVYVEVGSTEKEWMNQEAAMIIAQAVYETILYYPSEQDYLDDISVLLGIGGGHYAPRFTDIILERNAAFGHMVPSYHIDADTITEESIKNALLQTPQVSAAYIHTKGLKKPQVRYFKEMLRNLNIPVISSKDLPMLL